MSPDGGRRWAVVVLATAAFWSAGLEAQGPAGKPAPKPGAGAAEKKKPATLFYERYEASHRQRLRRDTCLRDEDLIAQYCVKKCRAGFVVVNPGAVPRECRSAKPLPEGQLPPPYRRQEAIQPVPPPAIKPQPEV